MAAAAQSVHGLRFMVKVFPRAAWKASGSIPFEKEMKSFHIRKERVSTVIWRRLYGRLECREI